MLVRYTTLALVMLLALSINFDRQRDNFQRGLLAVDGDGYWHLMRVQQMHQGRWDNEVNERGNAPYGERIHWTSAFDLVLLAGARIGSLFTDFETSLRWTGVLVGPVLFVVSALMLLFFGRAMLGPEKGVFPALLFAVDPHQSQAVFSFCRPDHHCFVMVLFILYYGSFMLLAAKTQRTLPAMVVGIIGALAIWGGLELFVLVGLSVLFLGFLWILNGEQSAAANLSLTACLTLGLFATMLADEKAGTYFHVSYDKRSIVHVTLFALIAVYWLAVVLLHKTGVGGGVRSRSLVAVVGAALLGSVYLTLFPGFLRGPLTAGHENLAALYLTQTDEFGSNEDVIRHFLLAIPGFIYLTSLLVRTSTNRRAECAWMLLTLCVYAVLGLKMNRWLYSLSILCVFPNAMILSAMLSWKSNLKNSAAAFGFCLLLLVGPHLGLLSQETEEVETEALQANYTHQVTEVLDFMQARDETEAGEIVLANIYLGPLIMHRTSFDVVGTPNHNNERGILDTYRILNAPDAEAARSIIRERGIDYLLLDPQLIVFGRTPLEDSESGNEDTFMDQLIDGSPPDWLVEVPLPESLDSVFRLFRVRGLETNPESLRARRD